MGRGQGFVVLALLSSAAAFLPPCPGVARSPLGTKSASLIPTSKRALQPAVAPLQAGPAELDLVVKNLLTGQDPTVLATVGIGMAALAAVVAYIATPEGAVVGQSLAEVEEARRLAAEEAERVKQAEIEAKVVELRAEAQATTQQIRTELDAKVQNIKVESRVKIQQVVAEATTRIELVQQQTERRIQRVREGTQEEVELPLTLNTAQVTES